MPDPRDIIWDGWPTGKVKGIVGLPFDKLPSASSGRTRQGLLDARSTA